MCKCNSVKLARSRCIPQGAHFSARDDLDGWDGV